MISINTNLLKLILLSCLFLNFVHAQQTVSGVISDDKGNPLMGVTIIEQGTNNGQVSDFDGNYSIQVSNSESILSFTYLGYEKAEVNIGSQTVINVTLQEDQQELTEVVVTALGFEESKDQLGYASSTVASDVVEGASETSLINALSGKASGLRVSRNSGDPGAGAYIQLRGVSSIDRDAQPLIVVDGIPISNASRGSQERFAAQSRLNDINPNDIESVNILKGASRNTIETFLFSLYRFEWWVCLVKLVGLMFGFWFVCSAIANFLGGQTGSYIDKISEAYGLSNFFLIFFVIPVLAGILMILLKPILIKKMHGID